MKGMDHFGEAFLGFNALIAIVTSIPVHGPSCSKLGAVFVLVEVCLMTA